MLLLSVAFAFAPPIATDNRTEFAPQTVSSAIAFAAIVAANSKGSMSMVTGIDRSTATPAWRNVAGALHNVSVEAVEAVLMHVLTPFLLSRSMTYCLCKHTRISHVGLLLALLLHRI